MMWQPLSLTTATAVMCVCVCVCVSLHPCMNGRMGSLSFSIIALVQNPATSSLGQGVMSDGSASEVQ